MPLSAAERARRYREKKKADHISREEYLLKERQRQRDIYVPGKDQAKRAKREIRRRWKENKRSSRKKQIEILVLQNQLATPPVSPLEEQQRANEERASSRQRGRKKVRRDRAKAYREIGSLKLKLAYQERATQKYKKRYYRTVAKLNKNGPTATPRSRAKWLLGSQHRHIPKEVRRTLIFHNALTDELKEKYKQNGELRMKQLIRKIATGRIIKKYRMLDRARQVLACHIGCGTDHGNLTYTRKARSDALTAEQRHTITAFFERDDNSRMSPGKKDTITKNKVKKQKRLLSDTMKILHEKFLFEHPLIKVCYSTFCTLRPFWVIKPKLTDRNTCLCKRHCNVELMAEKLHREGIISSNNPVEQFAHLVCSRENKSCMYGDCSLCDGKRLPKLTNGFNNKELTYFQWVTQDKDLVKKGADGEETRKKIKVTVKEARTTTAEDLYDKFETELKPRFTSHVFNISHQYCVLRKLKENLSEDEVIVHVDFSENYSCSYSEEIQSVHFGGSHKQVSLHTGVYYTFDNVFSFCSISESTRHDPPAIWAHLDPLLRDIRENHEKVTSVHFVSDGPTTQYRNKANFYLASVIPSNHGFKNVSWNFLEAGHGKGPADGIGGAIKRHADRLVAEGKDIPDGATLYRALLPNTTVKLYMIEDESISRQDSIVPTQLLQSVPGTMKIHQLMFGNFGQTHRVLSCFCQGTRVCCSCFDPKQFVVLKDGMVQDDNNNITADECNVKNSHCEDEALLTPVGPSDDATNQWCVVVYDGMAYPGIVRDQDEDSAEVQAMSRVGHNRYFWPAREDKIWYDYDDILGLIPEPKNVTSRHVEIDNKYWQAISQHIDF